MTVCCLCQSFEVSEFQKADFFRCGQCQLIFKDPILHLSPIEEKKRYDLHENSLSDPAYVNFLWPVVEQIKRLYPSPALGLDFGCGPGPVLSQLLSQENYKMYSYDPYFFPEALSDFKNLPTKAFDFITCTEVAEHFYHPGHEFKKLFSWLKETGHLVLMTDLFKEGTNLQNWGYARDPSHVCFFSEATLRWLAKKYGAQLDIISGRLVSFTSSAPEASATALSKLRLF